MCRVGFVLLLFCFAVGSRDGGEFITAGVGAIAVQCGLGCTARSQSVESWGCCVGQGWEWQRELDLEPGEQAMAFEPSASIVLKQSARRRLFSSPFKASLLKPFTSRGLYYQSAGINWEMLVLSHIHQGQLLEQSPL